MRLDELEKADFDIEKYVPGTNLELSIEGLVLMYLHEGRMKMRFPSPSDHVLKIDISKNEIPLPAIDLPKGSHIDIAHTGVTSTLKIDTNNVLDVQKLHPNLTLHKDIDKFSSLTISDSVMMPSVDKEGNPILTTFEFWEVSFDQNGERPILKDQKTKSGSKLSAGHCGGDDGRRSFNSRRGTDSHQG